MSEIYFEDVCGIGNLYLEKVLTRFEDEDIIFICSDNNSNRYLCLCYEFRYSLKWVIAKISIRDIARLIVQNIDIRSVYESQANNLIHIIYKSDEYTCEKLRFSELEDNILPKQGIFVRKDKTNIV